MNRRRDGPDGWRRIAAPDNVQAARPGLCGVGMRDNFVRVADGLEVGAALAELATRPDLWVEVCDTARQISLLDSLRMPVLRAELPAVWALLDTVDDAAGGAAAGRIHHARVGLIRPGEGVPPHRDGIDCVRQRRFQIALRSEPGVTLTVGGESRRPLPGEAWQINVARIHSVTNASAEDRITILFDTVLEG